MLVKDASQCFCEPAQSMQACGVKEYENDVKKVNCIPLVTEKRRYQNIDTRVGKKRIAIIQTDIAFVIWFAILEGTTNCNFGIIVINCAALIDTFSIFTDTDKNYIAILN